MFEPAGPVAREIEELTIWLSILGAVVLVAVLVAIAVALWRRTPDDVPRKPDASGISGPRWLVLGGGVVLPLTVVVVVFAWTLETMRDIPSTAPDDALVVNVTGNQWWWQVDYPDHGIALENELHLPTGRPVALHVESADVIHSFWIPALGGKVDAIPGRSNLMVVTVDRVGEYSGQCAEFCGLNHSTMTMTLVAHRPADFSAWIAANQVDVGTEVP